LINDDAVMSESVNDLEVHVKKLINQLDTIKATANVSHLMEGNVLNQILQVTSNQVLFKENLNVYRIQGAQTEGTFDAIHIQRRHKNDRGMFIIDNDEDLFNGDMLLFHKT